MRHGRTHLLLMASLWVPLAAPVWAEDPAAAERTLDKGRLELSTAASFTLARQEGNDEYTTILNVPMRLGFFATRRLELEAASATASTRSGWSAMRTRP